MTTIRIIKPEPLFMQKKYEVGDTFTNAIFWHGGATAFDSKGNAIEFFEHEYEIVYEVMNVQQPIVEAAPEAAAAAVDVVNNPSHYNNGRFETIEMIEEITKGYADGYQAYCVGNAIKYLSRAPFKHGSPLEDMRKAAKYIEFAIAAEQAKEGAAQ